MNIENIDKDMENIIIYLNENGLKPFASCDGVEVYFSWITNNKIQVFINLK